MFVPSGVNVTGKETNSLDSKVAAISLGKNTCTSVK